MDNNEMNQNVQTTETKPRFSMPRLLKVQSSPHIKSPETTATVMLDVLIALIPAFIWGVYVFGTRALAIGVISVAAAVGFEALTQFLLHRPVTVSDLSAAVTGLLLADEPARLRSSLDARRRSFLRDSRCKAAFRRNRQKLCQPRTCRKSIPLLMGGRYVHIPEVRRKD